ncbi:MAG: hypothetical protein ACPGLV_06665 [Bacteroidia bacterium]
MNKSVIFFLAIVVSLPALAQDNESYWALNLSSHFYNENSSTRHTIDVNNDLYRNIYNSSTGFYVMQPSLRKYNGRVLTEFGLRNTGWQNEVTWVSDNYNFNNLSSSNTVRQISAQTTLFFARSARILGTEKSGLYLGGDLNLTPSFQRVDFWDNVTEENTYNFTTTAFTLGTSVIPSYQQSIGKKLYLDFSVIISIINTSYEMQNFGTYDTYGQRNSVFKYSLGSYWTPQLGIGFKI